jgi:ArsR family transcriptional regulator, arsenate/arsenite/antimonite-responsive transcriptional repressor
MTEITPSEVAAIGKALGDPTRLSIYSHIANQPRGLFCGELGDCHMFSMATISHHLRVLTQAGLIASRRSGQHIFYRAIPARMKEYRRYLAQFGKKETRSKPEARGRK